MPAYTCAGALPVTKLISVLVAVMLAAARPQGPGGRSRSTKCKEFLELKQDRIGFILMWLDGYYTADEDPVVVDFDGAKTKAEKLHAYCAEHPALSVITAADERAGKTLIGRAPQPPSGGHNGRPAAVGCRGTLAAPAT